MKKNKKRRQISILIFGLLLAIGFAIPQGLIMPVAGASPSDYNANSFWYYPWGKSVTHKGVDIFATEGTDVKAATQSVVLFAGNIKVGGNVIVALGPKWRIHYYAHLKELKATTLSWVSQNETVGTVGTSGNAKGKPAHLHYAIVTMFPYFWRVDDDRQGWKKMFYLNPIDYLTK